MPTRTCTSSHCCFDHDGTCVVRQKKRDAHLSLADWLRVDYRDRRSSARERRVALDGWKELPEGPVHHKDAPRDGRRRPRGPPRPTLSLIIVRRPRLPAPAVALPACPPACLPACLSAPACLPACSGGVFGFSCCMLLLLLLLLLSLLLLVLLLLLLLLLLLMQDAMDCAKTNIPTDGQKDKALDGRTVMSTKVYIRARTDTI